MVVGLHEHAAAIVIATALDRLAQLVSHRAPAAHGSAPHRLVREPQRAIERRPTQDLGVDVMKRLAAPLPHPRVGLVAARGRLVDERHQEAPVIVVGRVAAPMPAPRQIHQLPERVELQLAGRLVADPHRRRAAVAVEVDLLLDHPALATDAVEDLEVLGVAGGAALDETAELIRLAFAAQLRQRPRAERRIADPGVAVVPVAPARRSTRAATSSARRRSRRSART